MSPQDYQSSQPVYQPVTTHTEDRITLAGGDELIVHGALFGQDPPEDEGKMSKLLSAVYSSS